MRMAYDDKVIVNTGADVELVEYFGTKHRTVI